MGRVPPRVRVPLGGVSPGVRGPLRRVPPRVGVPLGRVPPGVRIVVVGPQWGLSHGWRWRVVPWVVVVDVVSSRRWRVRDGIASRWGLVHRRRPRIGPWIRITGSPWRRLVHRRRPRIGPRVRITGSPWWRLVHRGSPGWRLDHGCSLIGPWVTVCVALGFLWRSVGNWIAPWRRLVHGWCALVVPRIWITIVHPWRRSVHGWCPRIGPRIWFPVVYSRR